ncbi:unnamed protein product [Sordaria macrospora k-hell]|uniref:WGS project CABT00000000 data, contig 2.1 n=1 Tax=Sordaria macrospora (strain ATCC MYA-333 / DSM 997 / K(L3346) / K-hell) TaxID=771870 RepID=F7VLT8_SORMK|nr:uncharacterized protein SMAC_04858 [Sordaria macrospora k-hell]CCC06466.1 unnamed protein product [Sordaria macrospora k-hell]
MSLQDAYKRFLGSPSAAPLADDASLHYITTTTSIVGASNITKHLSSLASQVKKEKETVLYAIEGQDAIALEVNTSLEFLIQGGPYLPGLEDNYVADRKVNFTIFHIVTFNSDGKITQIRQSWDQGSLLKQVEVIGRSGRNWPIRDSKDQISLINRCIKEGGTPATENQGSTTTRPKVTNAMRDPHASLSLFASREEAASPSEPVVSPYAGSRPRQRGLEEIIGDGPVEDPTSPSTDRSRSMTPGAAAKAGASKHFQPIRLFETDDNMPEIPDTPQSIYAVQRKVKPDPTKYKHFDFADGSDPADAPQPGVPFDKKPKTKHDSQWSFDDFNSPEKPAPTRKVVKSFLSSVDDEEHQGPSTPQNRASRKPRRDDENHWNVGNDGPSPEVQKNNRGAGTNASSHLYDDDLMKADGSAPSPVQRSNRGAGTNAASHLYDDDLMKADGSAPSPDQINKRGAGSNAGSHLYDDNLIKADGSAPSPAPRALSNITNARNREKHFEPHFDITDESPQAEKNGRSKAAENRQAAQRGLESHWSMENESPVQPKKNSNTGITIAGDGMGSRKGFEASTAANKGITIAGDGMGGKKGTERNWLTSEEDPQDLHLQNRNPGKKQTLKSDNFWDF